SNAGPFHECLNIAATWKLPMLYICENNMYAAQTAAAQTHALPDVAARAAGYGIPGVVVDGNDVFAVYQAANQAVAAMRRDDPVALAERGTDADRHRLLTDIAMHDTVDPAGTVIGRGAFLEAADGQHLAQHLALLIGRKIGREAHRRDPSGPVGAVHDG